MNGKGWLVLGLVFVGVGMVWMLQTSSTGPEVQRTSLAPQRPFTAPPVKNLPTTCAEPQGLGPRLGAWKAPVPGGGLLTVFLHGRPGQGASWPLALNTEVLAWGELISPNTEALLGVDTVDLPPISSACLVTADAQGLLDPGRVVRGDAQGLQLSLTLRGTLPETVAPTAVPGVFDALRPVLRGVPVVSRDHHGLAVVLEGRSGAQSSTLGDQASLSGEVALFFVSPQGRALTQTVSLR